MKGIQNLFTLLWGNFFRCEGKLVCGQKIGGQKLENWFDELKNVDFEGR